jgi:hypothetical protein
VFSFQLLIADAGNTTLPLLFAATEIIRLTSIQYIDKHLPRVLTAALDRVGVHNTRSYRVYDAGNLRRAVVAPNSVAAPSNSSTGVPVLGGARLKATQVFVCPRWSD